MPTYTLIFIAAFLLTSCAPKGGEEEDAPPPPATVPVHAGAVRVGDMPLTLTLTGRTDVMKKEKVFAPIAGRIVSLKVLEFQPVAAGDVIAIIQTKESQAAIDGARSLLAAASTPKQKEDARQMLSLAMTSQSNAVVRATLTGVVSTRSVIEGELVAEGAELATIVDPATVTFVAEAPLRDVRLVSRGQRAAVHFPAMTGTGFSGVVDAISPQAELQSQTVRLRIRFGDRDPGRNNLRADMIGTATIVTGLHRNSMIVPKSALLRNDENNSYSVIVVSSDSLAIPVQVEKGSQTDSSVEVTGSALRAGMLVVTEGNYAIAESTRVTLIPAGK